MANITFIFRKRKKAGFENCRLISLTSVPRKIMAQIMSKTISKHVKDKIFFANRQHILMKYKLFMTNRIIFYNRKTGSVPGEEAVAVLLFDFSKTFDIFTQTNLMVKVEKLRRRWVGIPTSWLAELLESKGFHQWFKIQLITSCL